jgi:hypothetical protein
MDDAVQIQIQCILDELRSTRMRIERAERRIQMLTDAFVVSGLWRTSSSLEGWKPQDKKEEDTEDHPLQFEMTND